MDSGEFARHAQVFVHWMAGYLNNVENCPVRSQAAPGDILAQLPAMPPEHGEAMDAIFADFQRIVMPGITHWQHPRFFAYFPANSSPPSVLAEMLTATLAAQCMLWETSPAAAELELRMMEWLRELIGLPGHFTGAIQDSASSATLCALIAAAERATGGRYSREGLAGGPPLCVYTSAEAHSSVEKAARIAGIGSAHVRKIAVDAKGAMNMHALAGAITADRAAGRVPACIVASFGATGIGAIDPIGRCAALAQRENIYLHVDAAWAGSALVLPEVRPLAAGIELADSLVFNPHKWLFTNFDCSAFYMRDPKQLASALSLTPSYLETVEGVPEYRDWSIALGRRFRALKLWFVLRSYGADALREKIRSHIGYARRLGEMIAGEPDFEVTTPPNLALLSFRYAPSGATELDAVNEALLKRINDSGFTYLTKTRFAGKLVIRFAIGQTNTEWRHVEEAWAHVMGVARALHRDRAAGLG